MYDRHRAWRERNKDKIKERNALRDQVEIYEKQKEVWISDPRTYLLKNAKRRAKRDKKEFSITIDDIHIPSHCPVLGYELTLLNKRGHHESSMSLDRKDNSIGYVPGNVFVISHRANMLKRDASLEEIEAILQYMKENK